MNEWPFLSPYSFSGNRVIDVHEMEGLEPEFDEDGNFTGFYRVQDGQGVTHIAYDMNDNYHQHMATGGVWYGDIIDNNMQYFESVRGDRYDPTNKDHYYLNMNPGDLIDLRFTLDGIGTKLSFGSYDDMWTSVEKTLEYEMPFALTVNGSVGPNGAGGEQLWFKPKSGSFNETWEGRQDIIVGTGGTSNTSGSGFEGGIIYPTKLKIHMLYDNSIESTLTNAYVEVSGFGFTRGLGAEYRTIKGYTNENRDQLAFTLQFFAGKIGVGGAGSSNSSGKGLGETQTVREYYNKQNVDSIDRSKYLYDQNKRTKTIERHLEPQKQ